MLFHACLESPKSLHRKDDEFEHCHTVMHTLCVQICAYLDISNMLDSAHELYCIVYLLTALEGAKHTVHRKINDSF